MDIKEVIFFTCFTFSPQLAWVANHTFKLDMLYEREDVCLGTLNET